MLVKIEDGFYLNSQHIIAIRVVKNLTSDTFEVTVEYTPNHKDARGTYQKQLSTKRDTEKFLQSLHQHL